MSKPPAREGGVRFSRHEDEPRLYRKQTSGPGGRLGTMTDPIRLSKSRFVAGWQCPKLLWWTVHEPQAKELQPGIVLQDLFDQGHIVGERARAEGPHVVIVWG